MWHILYTHTSVLLPEVFRLPLLQQNLWFYQEYVNCSLKNMKFAKKNSKVGQREFIWSYCRCLVLTVVFSKKNGWLNPCNNIMQTFTRALIWVFLVLYHWTVIFFFSTGAKVNVMLCMGRGLWRALVSRWCDFGGGTHCCRWATLRWGAPGAGRSPPPGEPRSASHI